jgi:predicted dehydrogenase
VVTNDSAKVAVVGCGYWGKNTSATLSAGLVRNFAQLGALRMVCDATEVGRQRATELAADCATVADPAEVWEAPVTGVVIATPAETHYDLTRQALLAGKDVKMCCARSRWD